MTGLRTVLALDGFDPKRLVSANRRIHHHVRAETCRYWRRLGRELIEAEYGVADTGQAWHQRVRIVVTFRFPNLIRRDANNFYPYVTKPLVDGFVDARLLPDDNDTYLVGPDHRRSPERGPHHIHIDIEDIA